MAKWVYFEDHTAVREADYRKNDELQARPARAFAGVWDDETQTLEPGKPKSAPARPAAKPDDDGA